ncbi:cytochrome P450 71D10-like [Prosopis cineraria]|uniref:cytochrome P450 71D10-like n=1 Tax=Prosopis cineraria TaxID=364024 RepID=UPI0024103D6F|nr:cytochrome P450 71D10-like [Prosopis cineraria]
MEIHIPYSVLFAISFFFIVILKRSLTSKKSIKTLPPGPSKLPIIGNLHQLVGSLPHHAMRDLANKYGSFIHLQLGELSHVVVSSPEIAREIMKTHDTTFANRPALVATTLISNNTDIAFSPYGNYWRQLRKICTLELLSAKRVQTFRTIREEEVSALVKDISEHEGSVINLSEKLYELTNFVTAQAAFGAKTKNVEQILLLMKRTLELASGFSVADLFPSLKFLQVITGIKAKINGVNEELDLMVRNIINDHEEKKNRSGHIGKTEDLVDVLLRIQKENNLEFPLTDRNIKAIIADVFLGGTETSASTVEWSMSELLRNPNKMKKAQEEVRRLFGSKGYVDESEFCHLKYVSAVIKETLRLHPPLPLLLPRENSEGCEINGYELPPKTRVIINGWAIGRNPKYWHEAERFEPERFLNASVDYNFKGTEFEYLPFGSGRRICPGVSFATVLVEIMLCNLLYHFDWKLPDGLEHEKLDMTENSGPTVRRKNDLCLIPITYDP